MLLFKQLFTFLKRAVQLINSDKHSSLLREEIHPKTFYRTGPDFNVRKITVCHLRVGS
jgi:hypothetical protein